MHLFVSMGENAREKSKVFCWQKRKSVVKYLAVVDQKTPTTKKRYTTVPSFRQGENKQKNKLKTNHKANLTKYNTERKLKEIQMILKQI